MVISGGSFRPDVLKPKEVVSLLLDDDEMEKKRELDNLLNIIILLLNSWLQVELFCQICECVVFFRISSTTSSYSSIPIGHFDI